MKRRTARGMTAVEILIGAVLLVGVLMGTNMMVSAGNGLAQSTNDQGVAGTRASRVIETVSEAMRKGSLASVRGVAGGLFAEGTSDTGLQIREVTDFSGSRVLSNLVTYRFDLAAGATEGEFVRSEDGVDSVIARGVTSFSVARSGNLFTFDVRTRSGPGDDRGRLAHSTIQITARNP